MNINRYDLASIIAQNNSGEEQAIEGYLKLLDLPNLPQGLIDDIREIISDEMNHNLKLNKWIEQLSRIKPAQD